VRLDLRKTGWQQITGDREGLHALRLQIDEVLRIGHGFQGEKPLPTIMLTNEKGVPIMPPGPAQPASTLKHPKAESA
jgi:predicted transcriptional regulator